MTELQLKRVVLYKTGLGFFEKKGTIDLSKEKHVKITFKNTTMNDLLKTFSIMRLKGDLMVSGVSYEGQNTNMAKLLEDAIINLPDSQTMQSLIKQLRGFMVKCKVNARKSTKDSMKDTTKESSKEVEGIIVGTQILAEPVSDKSVGVLQEPYIMLKSSDGSVQKIRVIDIEKIAIMDSVAQKDFQFFLDVVQSVKSEKFRNVHVYFQGEKQSEFLLTFLQELPAFKVSWRLYLMADESRDKDEKKGTDKDSNTINILLHGYAIIDNVLDENWENVKLDLVSGLPVSFNYDSYSPLWISRPTVERTANLEVQNLPRSKPSTGFDYGRAASEERSSSASASTGKTPLDIITDMVAGANVKGGGYQYSVPMPVNVKRNQSSLIPILENRGTAKMVSVYNENVDKKRSMSTLEFKNETGMVLEEGPIAVLKDDVFQGEAMLPFMEKGEMQRIPYAVNQAIEVAPEFKQKSYNIHEIKLFSSIYGYYFQENHKVYRIKNVSESAHELIIEHPKDTSYKLFETEKPFEESQNFYRFKISLDPQQSLEFNVKERRVLTQYFYYDSLSRALIEDWYQMKLISEKDHQRLINLVDYSESLAKFNINIELLQQRRAAISEEQSRIRENLKVLEKSEIEKKLRDRYVAKFDKGEAEMESIEKEIDRFNKEIAAIMKKRTDYINVEFKL